jgi:2-polyprenyl-3-methyl-5-hydroxy-6-metoxy-1,4-benzoquinol methylase
MTAKTYYASRWPTETKANLWAMSRASVILHELALLGIHNPNIVDFGCGTGWMTEILAQFGTAVGVDLAPEPARQLLSHLSFFSADALPQGPFDVVVSQEVLEHADNQEDYLNHAYRLLRPGGYLILTTPNAKVSLARPELLVQPVEKHLTSPQLESMLKRKFSILKLYSFFHGYARGVPYRFQMRFGRLLNTGLHLITVCERA